MISGKVFADFLCDRDQQHTSDRVADKSRYDLQGTMGLVGCKVVEVVRTNTIPESTRTTVYKDISVMMPRMISSITSNNPLLVTPFPRAIPPIARKTTVHKKCSKSS
jgi:hypothetical protein